MTWYISDMHPDEAGRQYRCLFSDEKITERHLEIARQDHVTAVKLWGLATSGRSLDRLAFLGDLPKVVYYDLSDIGSATLPQAPLGRLEVLILDGRNKTVVDPANLSKLWFFGGRAENLRGGRFGDQLRWLVVDRWTGTDVASLPFGAGIEYLRADGKGQVVSFQDIHAPYLETLELHNVEVESLAGIEGASQLKSLSLQPPGDGPNSLREIDLRSLARHTNLQWLRIGRQGKMSHLEVLAGLEQLQQVGGYTSFFPQEYLDAAWADPLPDSKRVNDLLAECTSP